MYINHLECCGLREFDGLSGYGTAKEALLSMLVKKIEIDQEELKRRIDEGMANQEARFRRLYPYFSNAQIATRVADSYRAVKLGVEANMRDELRDELGGGGDDYDEDSAKLPRNFRYAIFSQAGIGRGQGARYGTNLAAYITRNKLGKVISTGTSINPNSGNLLKVFVWTVDHKALEKWAEKQGYEYIDGGRD